MAGPLAQRYSALTARRVGRAQSGEALEETGQTNNERADECECTLAVQLSLDSCRSTAVAQTVTEWLCKR